MIKQMMEEIELQALTKFGQDIGAQVEVALAKGAIKIALSGFSRANNPTVLFLSQVGIGGIAAFAEKMLDGDEAEFDDFEAQLKDAVTEVFSDLRKQRQAAAAKKNAQPVADPVTTADPETPPAADSPAAA